MVLKDEPEAPAVKPVRKPKGAKYTGGGKYVIGVPARNLSAEEWAALNPAKQKALLEQGIMEVE